MSDNKSAKSTFRENKSCIITGYFCDKADCRTCMIPITYTLRKLAVTIRR